MLLDALTNPYLALRKSKVEDKGQPIQFFFFNLIFFKHDIFLEVW